MSLQQYTVTLSDLGVYTLKVVAGDEQFVERSVRHGLDCKSCFEFAVLRDLHFGAILSDDVLVIMPLPHHDQFREETMVLELSERRQTHVYHNYLSDLERLVRGATRQQI